MGRHAEGFKVRAPRRKGGTWTVRYRLPNGQRVEQSTGKRTRAEAEREGRAIYARAISGGSVRAGSAATLTPEGLGEWLDAAALRESTRALYGKYAAGWLVRLPALSEESVTRYTRQRLSEVRASTLRSELSALRSLVTWLVETGELSEALLVPALAKGATGKAAPGKHRTRAPELTPREVARVLAKLPERSGRAGFWVRPFYVLLYETGLRPSTIEALEVPRHWAPSDKTLRITTDIDKESYEREVPLTPKALAALRRVSKAPGAVFGHHWRRNTYLQAAASACLSPAKAAVFTGQHLRSARATHLLDAGGSLPGVQYLLGHRNIATTSRYVRASFRAAASALKVSGGNLGDR